MTLFEQYTNSLIITNLFSDSKYSINTAQPICSYLIYKKEALNNNPLFYYFEMLCNTKLHPHTKIITSLFGTRAPTISKKKLSHLSMQNFAIKERNTNNYRQLNYFFIQKNSYKL